MQFTKLEGIPSLGVKLRDNLIATGKIKVETPISQEESMVETINGDSVDFGNILGGFHCNRLYIQ